MNEALMLNHQARHYRGWLDEEIPALDGKTPRQAAQSAALKPKLVELLNGLEGMYEAALRSGEPAYEPSWMWGLRWAFAGVASQLRPRRDRMRATTDLEGEGVVPFRQVIGDDVRMDIPVMCSTGPSSQQ